MNPISFSRFGKTWDESPTEEIIILAKMLLLKLFSENILFNSSRG
jgi:hypothetical protein